MYMYVYVSEINSLFICKLICKQFIYISGQYLPTLICKYCPDVEMNDLRIWALMMRMDAN